MTYQINAQKLKHYAPKSNESLYLASEAEKERNKSLHNLKKLWYAARQIAWKYRDPKKIFWEALAQGELEPFKKNTPGVRDHDGQYKNKLQDMFEMNPLNLYLWQEFNRLWNEAVPLETAENLKTYKDLKQAENEIIRFVYQNWGKKLLGDYQPLPDSLEETCRFHYDIEDNDITVKGKFTPEKREIILSSEGVNDITILQTKGKKSWQAGIYFGSNETIVMNSKTAAKLSQMMQLASKLNLYIKQFIQDPEQFLGIESAKKRNQLYRKLREIMIEINNSYLRQRNERNKEKAAKNIPINENVVADRKQQKQREAELWLEQHPEINQDVDSQLGLSTI